MFSHVPVHRCGDHSGCCKNKYFKCKSKLTHDVIFTVRRKNEDGIKYVTVKFSNHSSCECKSICDGHKCPSPFVLELSEDKCVCKCPAHDDDCFQIFKGEKYLSNEARECVENGHCLKPVCRKWTHYNKRLGLCQINEKIFDKYLCSQAVDD